jgi:RNA recognition motif-containing protein
MNGNGGKAPAAGKMTSQLFVGNLPCATTAQELRELFAPAGFVTAVDLIFDQFTGRSRGFAFVNMATPEEAERVIAQFQGHDLAGRALTIGTVEGRLKASSASGSDIPW